jgi:DNA-binding response OmpR family regulator
MGKHILIVDDTADLLRLMRMMLEEDHHQVSVLSSGHGVVDFVRANKVDLIILDLRLGEIPGISVLYDLKHTTDTAHVPIVIYTASITEGEKAHQMITAEPEIYGGTQILQKPFSLDQLLEIVA